MKCFNPTRLVLLLALSVTVLAVGCTQVQVAPQTLGEYKMGELQVFADRNFATVYEAAKRGMKDANLFQTQDDRKFVEAELVGRDSADTRVTIKIKEVGTNRTSVKIRYGLSGNLSLAQKLYQSIEKNF